MFTQTCCCVTINFHLPRPQGDIPVLSAFGQVTRFPLKVQVERGPDLRNHINCSEGCMLWDLITVPTDLQSEVLPLPADVTGEEPASAWTTPLALEGASPCFPPQQLPFCISPLLNSFNLPSNHKQGWELGAFFNAVAEHQRLLTPILFLSPEADLSMPSSLGSENRREVNIFGYHTHSPICERFF